MRWLLVLSLCGCDLLFPEFAGSAPDLAAASTDGMSGVPEIQGGLCALADLRDLRSCWQAVSGGMHVSVVKTRRQPGSKRFRKFGPRTWERHTRATPAADDSVSR